MAVAIFEGSMLFIKKSMCSEPVQPRYVDTTVKVNAHAEGILGQN